VNILEFTQSEELLGDTFEGESWETWRAILSGAFAIPMEAKRRAIFDKVAGGRIPPQSRVSQLWVVAGRRSAKTHNAAAMAVYLASVGASVGGLIDKLSPGERGVIALLAVDRSQAKVALGYIKAMFEDTPMLASLVDKITPEAIHLNNRVSIEVSTNSYRSVRGRTLIAALLDECAYFRSDSSASPDIEVYRALVPGLATTGGMIIGFSSPYARRGLLYEKYKKHYGQAGDVLVVQGGTAVFNPTLDPKVIERAIQDDPESAKAEWLGMFREDVEGFVSRDTVEQLTRNGPLELPYNSRNKYFSFTDPSGGGKSKGADSFTLAIGHKEGNKVVIDLVRGAKGVPAQIVEQYAELMKSYKVKKVNLDRYGGSVFADMFESHGINAEHSPQSRSELYQNALPLINSARVEFPPCDILTNQLITLERRTARSGKITIDHAPGQHDDFCNSALGLVTLNSNRSRVLGYTL